MNIPAFLGMSGTPFQETDAEEGCTKLATQNFSTFLLELQIFITNFRKT